MKKCVSDLLDGYQDNVVGISGQTPLSSARIKELTMEKVTKERKSRLRRLPVRIAAAAAAVAAFTLSAFAVARAIGAGDLMQGLFSMWGQEPLSTTQVETLNGMGHVFDGSAQYSVTSNGATITPIAALADEDAYYLRLRIEAPEGTVLPDVDYWDEGAYTLYGKDQHLDLGVAYSTYAEAALGEIYYGAGSSRFDQGVVPLYTGRAYRCETLPDSDPADNVKELVLTIYSYDFQDVKFNDGRAKQLFIPGLWIHHRDSDGWFGSQYTEVFRGEFLLDIGGSFESQVAAIDCGGAEWTDPATGQVNCVDTMKLSPLGLKFEFRSNLRWENKRLRPETPGDVRIVMKDGSELSRSQGNSCLITDEVHTDSSDPYFQITPDLLTETPEWELGTYWAFNTPIDLSQVDYVQFGGNIYPISAG